MTVYELETPVNQHTFDRRNKYSSRCHGRNCSQRTSGGSLVGGRTLFVFTSE